MWVKMFTGGFHEACAEVSAEVIILKRESRFGVVSFVHTFKNEDLDLYDEI